MPAELAAKDGCATGSRSHFLPESRRGAPTRDRPMIFQFICWSVLLLLAGVTASLCGAVTLQEEFASSPGARGWRSFGDATLFAWNATNQNLEVTWDSSRTNSYFYRPLGTVLSRNDDFGLQFDLRLANITAGVNPEKPSTFEIAVGFIRLASATNATFSRGTGRDSPNLAEFDYFPPADIIAATVSPAIVSSNNQFNTSFTFPLELTPGDLFRISLSYTASNGTLVTTMTRNGAAFGPVKDVKLHAEFTDFRLDAVSINSYSDHGDNFGSVIAQGTVDDVVVTLPEPPIGPIAGRFTNGVWQVEVASRTNWFYTLEQTENLQSWTATSPPQVGTGANIVLEDTNSVGNARFHRVRAERP